MVQEKSDKTKEHLFSFHKTNAVELVNIFSGTMLKPEGYWGLELRSDYDQNIFLNFCIVVAVVCLACVRLLLSD